MPRKLRRCFGVGFYDPGWGQLVTGVNVDWGDGWSDYYSNVNGVIDHFYAEPCSGDSINVCFTVEDETNDTSHVDEISGVQVQVEPEPEPWLGGAPLARTGSVYTLDAGFSDPDGQGIEGWRIYWGDGASQYYSGNAGDFAHVNHCTGYEDPTAVVFTDDGYSYGWDRCGVSVEVADDPTVWLGGSCNADAGVRYTLKPTPCRKKACIFAGTPGAVGRIDSR